MENTDRPADDWDFSDDAFALGDEDLTLKADDTATAVPFVFTGQGGEYFRIWVINILLTMITLGLYSPWAKVRKAKYFRNNTQLDGHVFDYHGDPRAILRGRIIALLLFALYSWAFDFSKEVGVATLVFLCVAAPWLLMRGQQFALSNTSFRGLRFGFRARTPDAYRTVLPVVILWVAPSLLAAFTIEGVLAGLFLPIGLPWMHHRLKAYQHRNAMYGDRCFSFKPALGRFYLAYVGTAFLASIAMAFTVALSVWMDFNNPENDAVRWGIVAFLGLAMYLIASPYLATRLQQTIWNRTRLDDMRFSTSIRVGPLSRLVFVNVLLTLVSCGLYWPWAAVAMTRYRVQCLQLESDALLTAVAAGTRADTISATGDSVSDAFGFDIGL